VKITTDKDALCRALAAKLTSRVCGRSFRTHLEALDGVAPGGAFQGGAVHELLWPRKAAAPMSLALLLAKAASKNGGAIAWSDPERELYLPAISAAGIKLEHLILLRCVNRSDQLWALAECMRCRGISATVASIEKLNQIEARRLQLAAERGGGVGIFMRPQRAAGDSYAAATRWLIQSYPGGPGKQRWSAELLHGHGGQTGKVLLLEVDRESHKWRASSPSWIANPLRVPASLADRPAATAPARASA
jgi:hypothetical protein